jgi:4-amino-4-deoxy-L-arabinose transferase-like glycosyltransferase
MNAAVSPPPAGSPVERRPESLLRGLVGAEPGTPILLGLPAAELCWLLAALALATFLRLHHYWLAPPLADNHDELTWSWSGLTLITRHVPYAWTNFHSYTQYYLLHANNTVYKVVHPYFDDPPLYSILLGGFAWLRGARDLVDVTPAMIRPVPIALSLVTVAQVHLLAHRLGHVWPARLGALALAVAPGAVLFGRQAEAESLFAPLLLGALLLTHRLLRRGGGRWTAAGILVCCFLAPLAKFSGLAVPAACGGLLLMAGRPRLAAGAVAAAVLSLAAFAVYGAAYDWHLFLAVIQEQSQRRTGIMAGYEFITSAAGLGRGLRDGWWTLGWLGAAYLLARARDDVEDFVAWPILVYATVIFLFTDQTHVPFYGWYRIAAYPLLHLAAGFLVWRALRDLSPAALLAVLVLGGATSLTVVFGGLWVPGAATLVVLGGAVLLPALLAGRDDAPAQVRLAARIVAVCAVAGILLAAAAESWQLESVYALI